MLYNYFGFENHARTEFTTNKLINSSYKKLLYISFGPKLLSLHYKSQHDEGLVMKLYHK